VIADHQQQQTRSPFPLNLASITLHHPIKMTSSPLFSPDLIPSSVTADLPTGYTIRPLQQSDYAEGFLDVLRVLTTVGEITEDAWSERFRWIEKRADEYFLIVVTDESRASGKKIVGTGALVVERKFIHGLGLVGHIEDIAVDKDQQGKKLGLRIIQTLDAIAEKVGCYKVCLFGGGFFELHGLIWYRRFWIVQRRMRASMSSVVINGLAWKWLITMVGIRGGYR
jgi:glucosamine-phosphate N-acetyltransferase